MYALARIAETVAIVYISLVVLRELSILTAGAAPSVSRGIEFAIGTGHGEVQQ